MSAHETTNGNDRFRPTRRILRGALFAVLWVAVALALSVAVGTASDMALRNSPAAALEAARGLEYSVAHLGLASAMPPAPLLARPLLLGLAGVLVVWLLRRGWRRTRTSAARN